MCDVTIYNSVCVQFFFCLFFCLFTCNNKIDFLFFHHQNNHLFCASEARAVHILDCAFIFLFLLPLWHSLYYFPVEFATFFFSFFYHLIIIIVNFSTCAIRIPTTYGCFYISKSISFLFIATPFLSWFWCCFY